ncbi:hypothetical protein HPP92_027091 [Vanilla planifolia]|uniref:Uncharacterized protein n=1 Tax=Vanilla planifolia TaxID=51239 RepID=A0A835U526_VANPL|nr:hypothetical protein HPP92_027091 [Vanilla planifolia]
MTAASAAGAGEAAAKEVSRRFEALLSVRSKAMKGKELVLGPFGAFAPSRPGARPRHGGKASLLPMLCSLLGFQSFSHGFRAPQTWRLPQLQLRRRCCRRCRWPHLCPKPISSLPPFRKRPALPSTSTDGEPSSPSCLALVAPPATATCPPYSSSPFPPPPPLPLALPAPHNRLVLSGGKEDLGALAMLEDSVKRLKNPKATPCPVLPNPKPTPLSPSSPTGSSNPAAAHPLPHSITQNLSFPSPSGFTKPLPRTLVGPSWIPDSTTPARSPSPAWATPFSSSSTLPDGTATRA